MNTSSKNNNDMPRSKINSSRNNTETNTETKADTCANNIANKRLIIFDWDGTLMDSISLIVEAMHVAGQTHGFKTSDDEIKAIIGLSLKRGIDLLFPQASESERLAIQQSYADFYIDASENRASENQANKDAFFTGIEAMLQTLMAQGKELAIATGKKRAGLDRVMDASNSRHYFVASRCADESGSKPDPQMLLDILEQTQCQVEEAVFIGDSIHDIKMANALNMTSVAVNYGAGGALALQESLPTFQVDTPPALISLLTHTS